MSSTVVTPTDERFRFCGLHAKVLSVVIAAVGIVYSIIMTVTEIATEDRRDRLTWITLVVGFLLVFLAHALILVALMMKKPRLFNLYFFVQGFYVGVCIIRVVVLVYDLVVGLNKSGEPTTPPPADDGNYVMRRAVDLAIVVGYLIFAVCCYIVVRRAKQAVEAEQSAVGGRKAEEEGLA